MQKRSGGMNHRSLHEFVELWARILEKYTIECVKFEGRCPSTNLTNNMSVYLIALSEPNEESWKKISERWPDSHYPLTDTLALVLASGISTPSQIREAVGIRAEKGCASGLVVSVHQYDYAGVLTSSAVNWLKQAEERRESA